MKHLKNQHYREKRNNVHVHFKRFQSISNRFLNVQDLIFFKVRIWESQIKGSKFWIFITQSTWLPVQYFNDRILEIMCYPRIEFYSIRKANKLICLKIKYKYGFKHSKIYHYQRCCKGRQITHFQFTSKVFLSCSCNSTSYHVTPHYTIFCDF